jgi:bisphosphoglycerate-dependent phosphoglycerate mutase
MMAAWGGVWAILSYPLTNSLFSIVACVWKDVPLSETGEREALEAAHQLSTYFYDIDACFTSTLDRAQATTRAYLDHLSTQPKIMIEDYRLCERHYGESSLLF